MQPFAGTRLPQMETDALSSTAGRTIAVADATEAPASTASLEKLIATGGIRASLGLEPVDLRLGLDFARSQLQRGATQEAFRTYVALVLCDPSDPELQIGLANCALLIQENALALQAASAAVALTPKDPRGYYLSGRACFCLGHLQEAEEDLSDALALAREARNSTVYGETDQLLTRLRATHKAGP